MENLSQWMASIADKRDGTALTNVLSGVYNRLRSASLASAGLVIKAGGGTLVKVGATAWYGMAKGKTVTKAAATDMPALSGTVSNAAFNAFVFTVDAAGDVTTAMGTEGASLATIVYPKVNDEHCIIGFVIINPTGTGDFVGGTTALDDATVVPTAVYVSPVGAFALTANI